MKNILINVHTEYHLMVAVSLYLNKYSDKSEYTTHLLIPKANNKNRFKNVANLSDIGFDRISELDFSMGNSFNKAFSKTIKGLWDIDWNTFIFFHEQTAINVFLSHELRKKGTVVCLAPDGAKPYISVNKLALPSRIKETINAYKFLNANKLKLFKPYFLSWNYAKLRSVNEVWVQNADVYKNETKKTVREFSLFPDKSYVDIISKLFNFKILEEVPVTTGIFFYVNNILYKDSLYLKEIDIIYGLLSRNPGTDFYIKMHPLTPQLQIERFRAIPNIKFVQTSIPAELYIASLRQSCVLSMWSAALMNYNKECSFFWIYPVLEESGDMLDYLKIDTPFPHIKLAKNVNEIQFPEV